MRRYHKYILHANLLIYFFYTISAMLSLLFYAVIGGALFSILGIMASYTRSDKPTPNTIARDWGAGIIITFVLSLIHPPLMPPIEFIESISIFGGGGAGAGAGAGGSKLTHHELFSDYPLQIGIQPNRY